MELQQIMYILVYYGVHSFFIATKTMYSIVYNVHNLLQLDPVLRGFPQFYIMGVHLQMVPFRLQLRSKTSHQESIASSFVPDTITGFNENNHICSDLTWYDYLLCHLTFIFFKSFGSELKWIGLYSILACYIGVFSLSPLQREVCYLNWNSTTVRT